MKYVLGGTALAALAIAAPVWAQAPTSSNPSGAPSPAQPATQAQQPSQYGQQPSQYGEQPKPYGRAYHRRYVHRPYHRGYHHRGYHHRGYYGWAGRGPTDDVANQLNRAQLGGMAYGSSAPPAGYPPARAYPPPGPPPYQQ